jgi:hypothetical protein
VWYPIILSRIRSFHHKKLIAATSKKENTTLTKLILNENHMTKFEVRENNIKDNKKGQNEV